MPHSLYIKHWPYTHFCLKLFFFPKRETLCDILASRPFLNPFDLFGRIFGLGKKKKKKLIWVLPGASQNLARLRTVNVSWGKRQLKVGSTFLSVWAQSWVFTCWGPVSSRICTMLTPRCFTHRDSKAQLISSGYSNSRLSDTIWGLIWIPHPTSLPVHRLRFALIGQCSPPLSHRKLSPLTLHFRSLSVQR